MKLTTVATLFAFGWIILACTGCTSVAKVTKVGQLNPNKVVAFARVTILKDGENVSKYSNLIWNPVGHASWSTAYQHPLIENGLFCASMPAGNYYFWDLRSCKGFWRGDFEYRLKPDFATFALPEPGRAYYLGDLTINWKPKGSRHQAAAAALGGIVGAALMPIPGGEVSITVENNLEEAQRAFRDHFHSEQPLIPAIVETHNPNDLRNGAPPR